MTRALADLTWPVRTERLVLRPATADDAEATWRFRRLPEVGDFIGWRADDLERYRARYLEAGRLAATVAVEHGGTVVGDLMVRVEDAWVQAEVAERARGVQAELGLRRVTASCFADNTASWRLMERVGMRRELHAVAEALHRSRGWLDGFGYAMLAEEWQAGPDCRRARLG